MIWSDLRAHAPQVEMFRRALQRGRVAHAYLFLGPAGVGKRLVAQRIAQSLFCSRCDDIELDACGDCPPCRQMQAGTHADFLTVGLPEGKRELPIAAFLGPEDRRGREGLLHDLSLRPMTATRRIAVIDDADRMNEESANALLKTLEEPPSGSILFLISPAADPLLPTIRSRCQPLHFAPLAVQDVVDLLVAQGLVADAASARDVARLSEGSLDTARQLLEPQLRALREVIHTALAAGRLDPVETAQQSLKAIEALGGGSSGQRAAAGWLVRFAVDLFRQVFDETGEPAESVQRLRQHFPPDDAATADRLTFALERSLAAETQLAQMTPVPLCVESLFHDMARIFRGGPLG